MLKDGEPHLQYLKRNGWRSTTWWGDRCALGMASDLSNERRRKHDWKHHKREVLCGIPQSANGQGERTD